MAYLLMQLLAHAKPSGWNYPPTIKQEDPNKAAKVPQAVLSTTRKVGAVRAAKKEALAKKAAAESGDVDMDKGAPRSPSRPQTLAHQPACKTPSCIRQSLQSRRCSAIASNILSFDTNARPDHKDTSL